MLSLSAFQDGFVQALDPASATNAPAEVQRIARQPAFSVYRNTVMKGWIDALEASFPAVLRLVGDEWFRAAAAEYSRRHPPLDPVLLLYGADFPAFLASFEPAQELPYLAAVAWLDRLSSDAYGAPDAPALQPDALALLGPERLARAVLLFHPSIRFAWFEHNAPTIWFETRGLAPESDELVFGGEGEGVLIVRADGALRAVPIGPGGFAFLSACGSQRPLAEAAAAALNAEPGLDFARFLSTLTELGAFAGLTIPNSSA